MSLTRSAFARSPLKAFIRSPLKVRDRGLLPDDPWADCWRINVASKRVIWRRNLRQQLYDQDYPEGSTYLPKYAAICSYGNSAWVFGYSDAPGNGTDEVIFAPFVARISLSDGHLICWRFLPGEWDEGWPLIYYWYPEDVHFLYSEVQFGWPYLYISAERYDTEHGMNGMWVLRLNCATLEATGWIALAVPTEISPGSWIVPDVYQWCADAYGVFWTRNYFEPGSSLAGVLCNAAPNPPPGGGTSDWDISEDEIKAACDEGVPGSTVWNLVVSGAVLAPSGDGRVLLHVPELYYWDSWPEPLLNTMKRSAIITVGQSDITRQWCLGSNPEIRCSELWQSTVTDWSKYRKPFAIGDIYTRYLRESEEDPEETYYFTRGVFQFTSNLGSGVLGYEYYYHPNHRFQSLYDFKVVLRLSSGLPSYIDGMWTNAGDCVWNNMDVGGNQFPNTEVRAIASVNSREAVIAGSLLDQSEE